MKYFQLILSSLFVMILAAAIMWLGLIVLFVSIIAVPAIAWLVRRKDDKANNVVKKPGGSPSSYKATYKVVEADYKIVEK